MSTEFKSDEQPLNSAEISEDHLLMKIARQALEAGVRGNPLSSLDMNALPYPLKENGSCFVTLYRGDQLRGCVGSLEPKQPLAEDVRVQIVSAALNDYRFPPVSADELEDIKISISVLTKPSKLVYTSSEELLSSLRPGIDGVVIKDDFRRATFLPQVWEKIPDRELFLSMLCQKMGAPENLWRLKSLEVFIYQVREIQE